LTSYFRKKTELFLAEVTQNERRQRNERRRLEATAEVMKGSLLQVPQITTNCCYQQCWEGPVKTGSPPPL